MKQHLFWIGLLILLAPAAQICRAADVYIDAGQAQPAPHHWRKRWVASWLAVIAVNALDLHSSRGHGEANPLLRNSSGRFSVGKASLFKLAIGGGFFASQALVMRASRKKDYYRPFTIANTVAAGGLAGVVVHNYSLPAPRPRVAAPAP
jgi:hypothetical protein